MRAGDIIPADIKLLTGNISLDQSVLTGGIQKIPTRYPVIYSHPGLQSVVEKANGVVILRVPIQV